MYKRVLIEKNSQFNDISRKTRFLNNLGIDFTLGAGDKIWVGSPKPIHGIYMDCSTSRREAVESPLVNKNNYEVDFTQRGGDIPTTVISSSTEIPNGGYSFDIIPDQEVPGGIVAMRDFHFINEGNFKINVSAAGQLKITMQIKHTLQNGTSFVSTKTETQRIGGNEVETIQLADFNSITQVRLGSYPSQDNTPLTVTQELLNQPINLEIKLNVELFTNQQLTTHRDADITDLFFENAAIRFRQERPSSVTVKTRTGDKTALVDAGVLVDGEAPVRDSTLGLQKAGLVIIEDKKKEETEVNGERLFWYELTRTDNDIPAANLKFVGDALTDEEEIQIIDPSLNPTDGVFKTKDGSYTPYIIEASNIVADKFVRYKNERPSFVNIDEIRRAAAYLAAASIYRSFYDQDSDDVLLKKAADLEGRGKTILDNTVLELDRDGDGESDQTVASDTSIELFV